MGQNGLMIWVVSVMALEQQVKDPVLPQLGFNSWPRRNVGQKEKKKKRCFQRMICNKRKALQTTLGEKRVVNLLYGMSPVNRIFSELQGYN